MLLDYLEEVRKRSKEARRRFALTFSLVATGVIALVWLSVLFAGPGYETEQPSSDSARTGTQALESLRDAFTNTSDQSATEGAAQTATQPTRPTQFSNEFNSAMTAPATPTAAEGAPAEASEPATAGGASASSATPAISEGSTSDAGFVDSILQESGQ